MIWAIPIYTQHQVPVGLAHSHRILYIGPTQVFQLPNFVGDHTHSGDIEKGIEASVRAFNDIFAERGKGACARRAHI